MDGPDLSHLLDGDDSDWPSAAVLEGIVRRHRRLRARRARAAATLGLVLALTGAGVGIGLSQQHPTTSASGPKNPIASTGGSSGFKGVPTGPTGSLPASVGSAPAGLGWIATGSAANRVSATAPVAFGTAAASGRLQASQYATSSNAAGPVTCSALGCPTLSTTDVWLGDLPIRHLFTRTSDGVTVRAFIAVWAVAPLELVPVKPSGGTSSGHSATGTAATGTGTTGASGQVAPASTTAVTPSPPASVPTQTRPVPSTSTIISAPAPTAVPSLSCALTRALIVEVSDAGAVGVVTVPLGPSLSLPLNVLADQVVGVAEGSPIAVVVAHASSATKAVRTDFAGGGQDVMTVVDGWAVLVHPLAPAASALAGSGTKPLGAATVYALSSAGSVLERATLPGSGALAMAVGACEGGGNHKTPGSGSTGSAGSGSAGSGSAGSASGSTGSVGSTSAAPSDKPNGG